MTTQTRPTARTFITALIFGAALAACSAPEDVSNLTLKGAGPTQTTLKSHTTDLWRLQNHTETLTTTSCAPGTPHLAPIPISLQATPVEVGTEEQLARRMPETVSLTGAWQLHSSHAHLGGMSGLALLPEEEGGGLLAITDGGAFIWLGLDNGTPSTGAIAYMQGLDGKQYSGKTLGDAEGLVYADGLALVSFERQFRIEAFALARCGANARGAPVATLPERHNNRKVDENQGPEAIFLAPDGTLGFGYEGMLGSSPIGRVLNDGTAEWTGETAPAPALHGLVAMEKVAMPDGSVRTLQLFRAWDPVQGNRIRLRWGDRDDEQLTLSAPLLVDNFEGLAAEADASGNLRVWIISDDNYRAAQRNLLYAFDIKITQN